MADEDSDYETLYEDEEYFILHMPDAGLVELGFLARGMNLNFSYDEWQRLRSIVARIELPEKLTEEATALYEDDEYLFAADDELVRWVITYRMILVLWFHDGWERFRNMLSMVHGPEPWTVV